MPPPPRHVGELDGAAQFGKRLEHGRQGVLNDLLVGRVDYPLGRAGLPQAARQAVSGKRLIRRLGQRAGHDASVVIRCGAGMADTDPVFGAPHLGDRRLLAYLEAVGQPLRRPALSIRDRIFAVKMSPIPENNSTLDSLSVSAIRMVCTIGSQG
jgi:hypothetical protein